MTPPRTTDTHPLDPARDPQQPLGSDSDPTDDDAPRAGRPADGEDTEAGDLAGTVLELELGAPAHGGHMVARTEQGRVVFVRHGAPGEQVRVRLTEAGDSARYWRGDVEEVLRADPQRRAQHPWAAADSVRSWAAGAPPVGGAEFGHLDLPRQRELKTQVLRELLGGIGRFEPQEIQALDPVVEALPGEDPQGLGWRTRAHFAVDEAGRLAMHPHRDAQLTAVADMPLMVRALQALDAPSLDWTGAARVDLAAPSADQPVVLVTARPGGAEQLQDLAQRLDREVLPQLQAAAGAELTMLLAPDPASAREAGEPLLLSGWPVSTERIGDREWQVSAGGFWQIHRSAPARLMELVAEGAELQAGEAALDLYSGAGLLTAGLAEAVGPTGSVLAVEGSPTASADAADNFAGMAQVEAVRGSVEAVLAQRWPGLVRMPARVVGGSGRGGARGAGARGDRRRPAPQSRRPDVVVLDPPRAGAGKLVVDAISALQPQRIVSVSCDPATAARDLARFRHQGWTVRSLRGLDLYPNTHHLETIAVLDRR